MSDSIGTTTNSTCNNNHDRGKSMVWTRYQVSTSSMNEQETKKWIRISFDELYDTTSQQNSTKKQKVVQKESTTLSNQKGNEDETISCETPIIQSVPESVLRYQRQLRKIKAADRASKTNVNINDHLHTVYSDDQVVVANKPSGILCVPGVNKYKSLLDLVFEVYGSGNSTERNDPSSSSSTTAAAAAEAEAPSLPKDSMIVHRLDMDTSGIVIFARTRLAMSKLHESFRERTGTKKVYEALLVGWLDIDRWIEPAGKHDAMGEAAEETDSKGKLEEGGMSSDDKASLGGGEIHLPLQRDHRHPPFMRVSTPESEAEARQAVKDLNHAGYKKLIAKKPKPSTTRFRIISHEKWMGHPVTRVELVPYTGRTHQLRVHCAAMGHPILGDPAYGFCGEAHPNGGFRDDVIHKMSPTCAAFDLRRDVEDDVRESGRTMCLHARQLTLDHPVTKVQISFDAAPSF